MFLRIFHLYRKFRKRLDTFLWSLVFGSFGKHSTVSGRIRVHYPQNIFFGDHSTLNDGVFLNARAKIMIGNYVHISPNVMINAGGLAYEKKREARKHISAPVIIEDGAWLGSGCIVNPGVTIGANAVVAAAAVVTKDVSNDTVVAGVPARFLKHI